MQMLLCVSTTPHVSVSTLESPALYLYTRKNGTLNCSSIFVPHPSIPISLSAHTPFSTVTQARR